ncbi:UDP-N-acetylglucosamine 2-epimerase (hydrolyzing) [Gemmata sp. G18]|uniref:UDP-N-acetylglucosamine 2-epimerase (Hydrolyzing) n=1 Tax=Gemmata palustris TaxID=2822762 RepID=A0ABS5BQ00_9BACT|nr:UDP-N-acetylglucosamine 2-epimerase [Gemmata palustris]MBP3955809.1 UDP-N-acetylglucosamine 2-epimerase (hydrolyzing) [Gemmata palustris]
MRAIGVVTAARSEYGIYKPLLRKLRARPDADLRLFVTGMHLAPEYGQTVRQIEADGFPIAERIEALLASDAPGGIAASMGLGTIGFAQAFARRRPDILVVLGDRFEMHAAALAALPFKLPVAHIHGGEVTEGAIDDALRHSLTKLAHLHFVAAEVYARRVVQLGEEPWRVTVSGAPALDDVAAVSRPSPAQLEARIGLPLEPAPLLVTFHPVTLEYERTEWHVGELLAALDAAELPVVFTRPNADTQGRTVARLIEAFARTRPWAVLAGDLGTEAYFGLMECAAAMVGNSSSGLIEAPSFKLPVVNIGTRQRGRHRAANVIDVGYGRAEVIDGIRRATRPDFRTVELRQLTNPFDRGGAAEIIAERLLSAPLGDELVKKRFYDLPPVEDGPCDRAA